MNRLTSIADYKAQQKAFSAEWDDSKPCVKVCDGTGCRALGSQKVLESLREEVLKAQLDIPIQVIGTGCPGFCECGPLLTIYPERLSYQKVRLADIPEIVDKTLAQGTVIDRLLYSDPQTGAHIRNEPDLPFYKKQKRMLLDLNGRIDPTRIIDYIALGGYSALVKVLTEMTPDQVIAEITAAG